ncbi:MAG TPA: PDR/VanB family oxidoreductase [Ramlibacter sp.]|uniref:PDR/VanB family oxidoreductase n=1 Tax=Ramlibacter sp. TaxID=1917967 RepID=UPI002B83EA8D|nr:PDR/VanB family oxidoreductase [Ramlibacter sp.]HVZ45734.1 PDR/VanB family oxidoreductase [Ramlibacter sp.]
MKRIRVSVEGRSDVATDVVKLSLRKPDGNDLPAFTPGSHIDLYLPNGLVRQYSLLGDGRQTSRYEIAVSKAHAGRGGSRCVHADLRCGAMVDIGEPRNNFALRPGQDAFQFVAGGIGITPILSMIRHCASKGWDWRLLYLARTRAHAAFQDELRALGADRVRFHFDDEARALFDFAGPAFVVDAGVPIYCCGPTPVMNAVDKFSKDHPENPAFFEWFSPPAESVANGVTTDFRVRLDRSGRILVVPQGKSILQVLEESGYDVPCSCREGMCRTCETTVIEGVPDHRDYVLSREEREAGRSLMLCVSRAKSDLLVLDL